MKPGFYQKISHMTHKIHDLTWVRVKKNSQISFTTHAKWSWWVYIATAASIIVRSNQRSFFWKTSSSIYRHDKKASIKSLIFVEVMKNLLNSHNKLNNKTNELQVENVPNLMNEYY